MADRLGILSGDLWSMRDELAAITGATPVRIGRGPTLRCTAILGWDGPRGRAARAAAGLLRVPFRSIAIGPLNAIRPDGGERPVSLVLHGGSRSGVHSRTIVPDEARAGLAAWRQHRLSWRNDGRDLVPAALDGGPFVLVVVGSQGQSGRAELSRLADRYPGHRLATVADSQADPALAETLAGNHPAALAIRGTNPHALFDRAAAFVAAPGSSLGRDALLAGVPTLDGPGDPAERHSLFAASFLSDVVYLDPWSHRQSSFADVAGQLAWLRDRFHENDRPTIGIGISRWKRDPITRFLDGPDGPPHFAESIPGAVDQAKASSGRIVVWETRLPRGLEEACAEATVPLERMEDGFLRSVGLGAAFQPGASTILDRRGIYYDPRRPSDLEHILATTEFTPDLLDRARRLRERIVALRLSKYNVGQSGALQLPGDRPLVLVPGQVEDDASVLFGSPQVRGNRELLAAARRLNPDAFLLFKPHPDVAAGLRKGRIEEAVALRFADRLVVDLSIADLLDRVDRIETMTSLTGFEALLRGKQVGVHGGPFYAGWGLTLDRHPPPRRGRHLSLDALVAATLILYPRYLDPATGLRCPPEILVDRLAAARDAAVAAPAFAAGARAAYVRARYALLGPVAHLLRRARGSLKTDPHGTSGPTDPTR